MAYSERELLARIVQCEAGGEGDIGMKAVASVTFDNEFAVHDIKVIEKDGLFIAMPSKKTPNGEFKDIAHPINAETREKIQAAILEAYNAPEEESAE
mgnify:CR=1 FL=1